MYAKKTTAWIPRKQNNYKKYLLVTPFSNLRRFWWIDMDVCRDKAVGVLIWGIVKKSRYLLQML